ncbi:tellurite resistance TerB family protein [Rubinisphaera margarita]|uniref:tellurite resistance TerB family protein n=1 Tax=Rubinisphaera margarita TaxID=2909586 RepID=UPI001EE7AB8B|nr:TerB family tellurite resistance protein [Rubinisphaera margarita]MCG6156692.1 TerB family tellurite resistance protein [Rubinisphaera margarita]
MSHFTFLDYISFVEDDSSSYEVGVTDNGFSYLDLASEKKRRALSFAEKQKRESRASKDGTTRAHGKSNVERIELIEPDMVCFDTDLMAIIRDIEARRKRPPYLPWGIALVVFLATFWLLIPQFESKAPVTAMVITGIVLFPASFVLIFNLLKLDHSRRHVKFSYRIEGKGKEAFHQINNALDGLSDVGQLLLYKGRTHFQDTRYSGGDSSFPNVEKLDVRRAVPPLLDLDFPVWKMRAFNADYFFMPDHLLVFQGSQAGGVSYEKLKISANDEVVQARERIRQMSDSHVVGHTWRFTNNDGTPDQRFNDNQRIPKLRLGVLSVKGEGVDLSLYVSDVRTSQGAPNAFTGIQELARKPMIQVAEQRKKEALAEKRRGSEFLLGSLLNAMCCVMLADREIAKKEVQRIHAVFKRVGAPWEDEEIKRRLQKVLSNVKSTGLDPFVEQTCESLSRIAPERRDSFIKCVDYIVSADGKIENRERRIRDRFASALRLN